MSFMEQFEEFDDEAWKDLIVEIKAKSLSDFANDEKLDVFISALRWAASYYKMHVHSENTHQKFREIGETYRKNVEASLKNATELSALLHIPGIADFITHEKAEALRAELGNLINAVNGRSSNLKMPPAHKGRGAERIYSTDYLAITFEYIWGFYVGLPMSAESYGIAEKFFIAAGYTPKDKRGDGTPSNIGRIFRKARKLKEGFNRYEGVIRPPYILLGQLKTP